MALPTIKSIGYVSMTCETALRSIPRDTLGGGALPAKHDITPFVRKHETPKQLARCPPGLVGDLPMHSVGVTIVGELLVASVNRSYLYNTQTAQLKSLTAYTVAHCH